MRRRMRPRKDYKVFKHTANMTDAKNLPSKKMSRGGTRLL